MFDLGQLSNWLAGPLGQFVIAVLLTVIANKMSAAKGNAMVAVAWLLLVHGVFRSLGQAHPIARVWLTALAAGGFAGVIWYWLWTKSVAVSPHRFTLRGGRISKVSVAITNNTERRLYSVFVKFAPDGNISVSKDIDIQITGEGNAHAPVVKIASPDGRSSLEVKTDVVGLDGRDRHGRMIVLIRFYALESGESRHLMVSSKSDADIEVEVTALEFQDQPDEVIATPTKAVVMLRAPETVTVDSNGGAIRWLSGEVASPPPQHSGTLSVRVKYSGTQMVRLSSEPFGTTESIDLDGAGRLFAYGRWDLEGVQLMLSPSAPLLIDKPASGTRYPVGGGISMEVNDAGGAIQFSNAATFQAGQSFMFNRTAVRTNTIESSGRRFQVTLQAVRDRSGVSLHTMKPMKFYEYEFGINEE